MTCICVVSADWRLIRGLRGFRRPKRGPDRETRGSHAGRSGKLDSDEPGIRHHAQEIPNRDRTAYSIGPGVEVVSQFCRQVFIKNNVGQL